jgi:NADH-quinone oxidoreductase subunit G
VWLRAKPEWAKGPRIVRVTPRFNPDVNEYWMCDIGRFDYHFVEADDRLRTPMVRDAAGVLQTAGWHDLLVKLREAMAALGGAAGASLRLLTSAHASLEELAVIRRIANGFHGDGGERQVAIGWRTSEKKQPSRTKFVVPTIDGPNLAGARDLGFLTPVAADGAADLSGLRQAVESGAVRAVYVLDPGPAESLGDVSWLAEARRAGTVKLLAVQGILMTDLARAADFVLPGAAYLEKDACYRNDKGIVQAASQVVPPPGDAMVDWRILVNVAVTLGVAVTYASAAQVRADIAAAAPGNTGYADLARVTFRRPVAVRAPLEASNPSERLKWDALFKSRPGSKPPRGPDPASTHE